MTKITLDDMRQAKVGTCQQARIWFRKHGIEWHEIKNGTLDADRVRNIADGNTHIQRVIRIAEEREKRG